MFEFVLIMTIVTSLDKPDIQQREVLPSMEACWDAAHSFVENKPEDMAKGAIGLGAGCAKVKKETIEQ